MSLTECIFQDGDTGQTRGLDISVILPVRNEADNLHSLLPRLREVLEQLGIRYEILVIDGGSRDDTAQVVEAVVGAHMLAEQSPGYPGALTTGFGAARGAYVLTLEADPSHDLGLIGRMWRARQLPIS